MKIRIKIILFLLLSVLFIFNIQFISNAYSIRYIKDKVSMGNFTPSDYSAKRNSFYDAETDKEVFELTNDVPEIEGYNFVGWKIGDTNEVLLGGRKILATSDITVIGQFMIGSCNVKYVDAYSDTVIETVTTGRDYKVKEPGFWHCRTFVRYDIYDNEENKIGEVRDREVIAVDRNIVLKAVWSNYNNDAFVEELYIKDNGSNLQAPFLQNTSVLFPSIGIINRCIGCKNTNNPNNAITDIKLFEGSSYVGLNNINIDGLVYEFAKLNNVPYNLRSETNFGGEPLFIGYAKDPNKIEKVIGNTVLSKSYDKSSSAFYEGHAYHNVVKYHGNDSKKNILDGTTYIGSSINTRDNYIVYDKYDPKQFFDESMVFSDEIIDSAEWMKKIPDNYYITEINIPGTHDSSALQAHRSIAQWKTQTQKYGIYELLNQGVRGLDIRTFYEEEKVDGKKVGLLKVIHGASDLDIAAVVAMEKRPNTKYLLFEDVLAEAIQFVTNHPSETILMSIQSERDYGKETRDCTRAVINNYMYGYGTTPYYNRDPGRIWVENRVPTMREARGKVVIFNYWWNSNNDYKNIGYGIDFHQMDDSQPRSSYMYTFTTEGGQENTKYVIEHTINPYLNALENGGTARVEHRGAPNFSRKYIWDIAMNNDKKRLFYYLNTQVRNGADGEPFRHYKDMHKHIKNHYLIPGVYYGQIDFDFADRDIASKIYNTNFSFYNWK